MKDVINDLYEVVLDRKENGEDGSYTKYLFGKGLDKILKKVGEEATEVIIAAKNDDKDELVGEICDLTYHLMVMMADKNIDIKLVEAELEKRREKIGNFKGERKEIKNV